jgi:hypothetical protein
MQVCPICHNKSDYYCIDTENLQFLTQVESEGKINLAVSMTRVLWNSIPQVGLSVDSRQVIDEISKALIINTQNQLNTILAPMKMFMDTFPRIIEKLPESMRKDVREEFCETRLRIESEFKTLRESTPTFKDTFDAMQTITEKLFEVTQTQMDSVKKELTQRLREILKEMGFPEPQQLKILSQLMPLALPLLEQLLRLEQIPSERGKRGELELAKEIEEYYPEDDCVPIGDPGDTDLVVRPRSNGITVSYKILIESKKNSSSWSRSFIEETKNHMRLRGERFAILAVQTMPKGTDGFLIEQFPEGVLLITNREYFRVAYGSLRASINALRPFGQRELDFSRLFADQKIGEVIKQAFDYCGWVKKIRERASRIESNADGINQDIDELDKHLRRILNELQNRINIAINSIATRDANGICQASNNVSEEL